MEGCEWSSFLFEAGPATLRPEDFCSVLSSKMLQFGLHIIRILHGGPQFLS